jgi:hypothetical protein
MGLVENMRVSRQHNARISGFVGKAVKKSLLNKFFVLLVIAGLIAVCHGCGVINPGKWKGIEKTAADEKFYLVKDVFLTAGSAYTSKETFDHNLNDSINLFFTPTNEKSHYVAESIWYDPMDQEYRTIRSTQDVQQENKKDFERKKGGTPRVHTISTRELFDRKPGLWKVALYLDGQLARRLSFSVR